MNALSSIRRCATAWTSIATLGLAACGGSAGGAPPQSTLQVTVVGRGFVSSAPAGIACSDECSKDFATEAVVTLVAIPGAASVFSGWTGDAACNEGQVTMGAARHCTATFAPKRSAHIAATKGTGGALSSTAPAQVGGLSVH